MCAPYRSQAAVHDQHVDGAYEWPNHSMTESTCVGHTKQLVACIPGQHAEHGSDTDDVRELPANRFDVAYARRGDVTGRGCYRRQAENRRQAEQAREAV